MAVRRSQMRGGTVHKKRKELKVEKPVLKSLIVRVKLSFGYGYKVVKLEEHSKGQSKTYAADIVLDISKAKRLVAKAMQGRNVRMEPHHEEPTKYINTNGTDSKSKPNLIGRFDF